MDDSTVIRILFHFAIDENEMEGHNGDVPRKLPENCQMKSSSENARGNVGRIESIRYVRQTKNKK